MFCAPSLMFESSVAFETDSSAVNGGQMTTSTSFTPPRSSLRLFTSASDSATVLFIFQLPAMMSLRALFISNLQVVVPKSFLTQGSHTRQRCAFEEFQTRAATCTHESDF